MKSLRILGIVCGAAAVAGSMAVAHPSAQGNYKEYDDVDIYGDTVVVLDEDTVVALDEDYIDSVEWYDHHGYDAMADFESIKDNPYLSDPDGALEFRLAFMAYNNGDYDEAWFRYKALADVGYPYADYMGRSFDEYFSDKDAYSRYESKDESDLTPKDLYVAARIVAGDGEREKALALYEKAFENGFAPAAAILGTIYYLDDPDGFLDLTNREKTIEWTRKGVEANDSIALYNMGVLYDEGMVFPRDLKLAAEYYEKAAALGMPSALNNLATNYAEGLGVKRDIEKALELKKRAAKAGHANSAQSMAINAVLMGNYDESLNFSRLAAKAGQSDIYDSMIGYALSSNVTTGLRQDADLVSYIKQLYSEGLVSGLLTQSIKENTPQLLELLNADWQEIADNASRGDTLAMKQMVWDALYGLNVHKDYGEAMRRLEKLANLDERYRLALALSYYDANEKERNLQKSKENLEKFIADHDDMAIRAAYAMEIVDEEVEEKFMNFEALGVHVNQNDVIYAAREDDLYGNNRFVLPPSLSNGPQKLESYMELLGRKDEILKKADEGDADALYDLYNLIEKDFYSLEYAPGIAASHQHYLIEAAIQGHEKACEQLSQWFRSMGNESAARYWVNRTEASSQK